MNGVYPDFVLADKSGTDTAVVQLKAGGNEGLQYTLRIHRLSKAEDFMVYVNANHVKSLVTGGDVGAGIRHRSSVPHRSSVDERGERIMILLQRDSNH